MVQARPLADRTVSIRSPAIPGPESRHFCAPRRCGHVLQRPQFRRASPDNCVREDLASEQQSHGACTGNHATMSVSWVESIGLSHPPVLIRGAVC